MRKFGSSRAAWGLAAAGACTVLMIAGCGSDSAQRKQAQQLGNVSVLSSTAPLAERLVSEAEVAKASDTNAAQTFLRLWSLLQFQSWDGAAQLFQPGLRASVSEALLAQALQGYQLVWQSTKPAIRSAEIHGKTAVIKFLARSESGQVVPASISFERGRNGWLVSYFSMLDPALQRAAQLRAQGEIDPLATKPSLAAVRQGANALLLQSFYRERLLKESAAARARDRGLAGP
jgi:hypothetical protein